MVSADDRRRKLETFAKGAFAKNLLTTDLVHLSSGLRWAIAKCARDALVEGCQGCASLGTNVCLPRGCVVAKELDALNHTPSFLLPSLPEQIQVAIVKLVHSVINMQARLDFAWYQATIQELLDSGILDYYNRSCKVEDTTEIKLYAIFAEIVLVAVTSHGIHSTYLVIGQHDDGIDDGKKEGNDDFVLPNFWLPQPPPTMNHHDSPTCNKAVRFMIIILF